MRRIIVQLDYYPVSFTDSEVYRLLYKRCVPTIRQYASLHKIDYELTKLSPSQKLNKQFKYHFFHKIHQLYASYDQIAFVDLDITAIQFTENIFDYCDKNSAMTFAPASDAEITEASKKLRTYNLFIPENTIRPNSGFVLFHTNLSNRFFTDDKSFEVFKNCLLPKDELYLTLKISNKNIPCHYFNRTIGQKWNYRGVFHPKTKQTFRDFVYNEASNVHFIHWLSSHYTPDGTCILPNELNFRNNIEWHLSALSSPDILNKHTHNQKPCDISSKIRTQI